MSVAERAYIRDVNELSKKLKRGFHLTAELMPAGFTDDDYLATYKECFSGQWQMIVEFKKEHDIADQQRRKKGLSRLQYNFPKPEDFVLFKTKAVRKNIRDKHKKGVLLTNEEREALRRKYTAKAAKREAEKEQVRREIENMQQNVAPAHTNYFIKTYFYVKRVHPEDVDTRMRILEEAAKFKCYETEVFFRKVNAAERNYTLRNFAFRTLQATFGYSQVHFHANRKGKQHVGDTLKPKKMDSPELLMKEIYNSEYDLEKKKSFDVFLSHSSKDYDTIIMLKTMLNSQGLTVYVDWVEDRQALKRDLTSVDTARAIIERINQSGSILYVLTKASINSRWTPWELGYAHAKGNKICALQMEAVEDIPEYLQIYDEAVIDGDEIVIKSDGLISIKEWMKK